MRPFALSLVPVFAVGLLAATALLQEKGGGDETDQRLSATVLCTIVGGKVQYAAR